MSVTPETAASISNTLVRVMKIVGSMKSHLPLRSFVNVEGLDHSHFPTLFSLAHEPRRVSALAEFIHSDVSTVSRQVSHLVQLGLVEKIGDPDDGRAQLLSLSPTGSEVIDELVKRRGEWFEVLLKGWSEHDAAMFLALLERFNDDVERFKVDLTAPSAAHAVGAGSHADPVHTTAPAPASRPSHAPQLAHASAAAGHTHSTTHTNQEH